MNASLEFSGGSAAIDQATRNVAAAGVLVTVASGNSAVDACGTSPARTGGTTDGIITVNASDATDRRGWFSNFGACTDMYAPGVGIRSASILSTTATTTMDGTSMAAPHVAGAAALYLDANPTATPTAVEAAIRAAATPNPIVGNPTGTPNRLLYIAPQMPALRVATFQARSAPSSTRAAVQLTVPLGYKVLSCGARVNYTSWGQLLTELRPIDERTCVTRAKAHGEPDLATIDLFVTALVDPANEWEQIIRTASSARASHPCQTVQLPSGYALTGGGAVNDWVTQGSLLTLSRPAGTTGWQACSKDHLWAEPVSITASVIGIRPRNGLPAPQVQLFTATGATAAHPTGSVSVGTGFVLVGGGAQDQFSGWGNMLTASYPTGSGWAGAGKDHIRSDPGYLSVWAIGLR
jgi:hypothetical protein